MAKSEVWGQPSQSFGVSQVRGVVVDVRGMVGQVTGVVDQVRGVQLVKSKVWSAKSEV
jgi:hypothetical protein